MTCQAASLTHYFAEKAWLGPSRTLHVLGQCLRTWYAMTAAQQDDDWMGALALSRQPEGSAATLPITDHIREIDPVTKRLRITLRLQTTRSSSAVGQALLAAFAEATTAAARARERQLLPRCVEINLPSAVGGSGSSGGQERQAAGAAAGSLVVQFTATEPAAETAVEEAARLFEVGRRRVGESSRHPTHS